MPLSSKSLRLSAFVFVCALTLVAIGCSGNGSGGGQVTLRGAGATYPNPLYQKWISEYGKLHANVRIDYQSIGSGGGQKQIREQTVDFGATDSFMSDQDLKSAPGELLHIPMALGAVVITYNSQGISQPLHFSSDVVADVFLGKIKRWDDPRIKAENAGLNLPAADITVSIGPTVAAPRACGQTIWRKSVLSGSKKLELGLR